MKALFPSAIALVFLFSACDFAAPPTPEPTPKILNVAWVPTPTTTPAPTSTPVPTSTPTPRDDAELTCAGEDPSLKVLPSLVEIKAWTDYGPVFGSGFIVDGELGYILSATRVVADVDRDSIAVTYRNGVIEQAVCLGDGVWAAVFIPAGAADDPRVDAFRQPWEANPDPADRDVMQRNDPVAALNVLIEVGSLIGVSMTKYVPDSIVDKIAAPSVEMGSLKRVAYRRSTWLVFEDVPAVDVPRGYENPNAC